MVRRNRGPVIRRHAKSTPTGEWAVVGFPFGIGSTYIMDVYYGGGEWPDDLEGMPGKPSLHKQQGSKEDAFSAMVGNGSSFVVSL